MQEYERPEQAKAEASSPGEKKEQAWEQALFISSHPDGSHLQLIPKGPFPPFLLLNSLGKTGIIAYSCARGVLCREKDVRAP